VRLGISIGTAWLPDYSLRWLISAWGQPRYGHERLGSGTRLRYVPHPASAGRGAHPIEDAGPSHGAQVFANPGLDLSDPATRRTHVDDWLQQIALDARLSGVENHLIDYHPKAGH
jgi:hypothetical protein